MSLVRDRLERLHLAGEELILRPQDFSPPLRLALQRAGVTGDPRPVFANYSVTGDPEDCREYIKPLIVADPDYEKILKSNDRVLKKLVVLIGENFSRYETAYLATF